MLHGSCRPLFSNYFYDTDLFQQEIRYSKICNTNLTLLIYFNVTEKTAYFHKMTLKVIIGARTK